MPVDVLRCRVCESEYPAVANGICARCFGPLEPVYDWDEVAAVVTRERSRPGRARCGATAPAARRAAGGRGQRAGAYAARAGAAARAARSASARCCSSSTSSNPTHSFKDRVVAIAAAKASEFGLDTLVGDVDRQPRERGRRARGRRRACTRSIFCPAGLEPEKLAATTVYGATVYGVRGSYDDCSRLVSELAGEVEWGIVNVNLRSYYAEGSKTLAFEICEQLGWETPDAVVMPIGSGAMFTKVWLGLPAVRAARADRRRAAAALRRPGRGLRAGGVRVRRGAARLAGAAEHDRLVDRDRQPGRRRPRDREGARVGRRRSTPCPRTRSARTSRCSPRRRHLRRGRDGRRDRRAARGGRARRARRATTASSCSSPAPA